MKCSLLPALFLLAGCQHVPPMIFVREVPVQVTSTNYLDVIRFPSAYKAYTVGRRSDPADPTLMHEAHILYVRESPERWNLQPPSAPAIPPVNPSASVDAAFAPLPMSEQLRQEVQKQEQLSRSLQQSADLIVPAARKTMELTIQIQQRQQALEDRLRRLEEAPHPASLTNWPGFTNRQPQLPRP